MLSGYSERVVDMALDASVDATSGQEPYYDAPPSLRINISRETIRSTMQHKQCQQRPYDHSLAACKTLNWTSLPYHNGLHFLLRQRSTRNRFVHPTRRAHNTMRRGNTGSGGNSATPSAGHWCCVGCGNQNSESGKK